MTMGTLASWAVHLPRAVSVVGKVSAVSVQAGGQGPAGWVEDWQGWEIFTEY